MKDIKDKKMSFVLAEIGLNHNRDVELAHKMIDRAVECGGDGVKFQTYITENLMTTDNPAYKIFKELELDKSAWQSIADHCRQVDTNFVSTPFCHETVDLLGSLGVNAYKVASCDITYLDLIEHIAKMGKPMIISTGMSSLSEMSQAVEVGSKYNENITLFHCLSKYPPNDSDMNLTMITTLAERFPHCRIGLSDHTGDFLAGVIARTLGATFFEKHFTLDKNLPGPDQQISSDPSEFAGFVTAIERAGRMLQQQNLESRADLNIAVPSRRSIFSKTNIEKGTVLTKDNLTALRPGDGIGCDKLNEIVGKTAKCDIPKGTKITSGGIE